MLSFFKRKINGREGQKHSRKTKNIRFVLEDPHAKQVSLAGSFNDWNYKELQMEKKGKSRWEIEVPLWNGSFEYKFVVDGGWKTDPMNEQKTVNPDGTINSVKTVEF